MDKPTHRLLDIDVHNKTAYCLGCKKRVRLKWRLGRQRWICLPNFLNSSSYKRNQNRQSKLRVRNPYSKYKKSECERCHFLPEHSCQLDIHHKDGDHKNNKPENLQTLCANCHRLVTWVVEEVESPVP